MNVASLATAVLGQIDWKSVFKKVANDSICSGLKSGRDSLVSRLKPDDRERAAREAVSIFTDEFLQELEDKSPLSSALPGYQDDLKQLLETAAPDISACLQPQIKAVDLGSVARMWSGLGLHPLPEGFSWALVAENYGRVLRRYVKRDPDLRGQLELAVAEDNGDFNQRFSPGFELGAYGDFLRKKCATLQLSPLHASVYDRRVGLWSVFVPQSARESAPVRHVPRELLRRMRAEGHVLTERDEQDAQRLRETYTSAAVLPVLDVLDRQQRLVLLGDPGSGKTSLLKYMVLRWVNEDHGPVPLWIDLKEYARQPDGMLRHLESEGCFGLEARFVDDYLRVGKAALYLDGLDEIFEPPIRATVIEQIAAFSARYPQARCVVTSRIIGYEPERLGHAGFAHATLEEFDDSQVGLFLDKWHTISEEDPKERSRLTARLKRAVKESRPIRELAGNPLLLTMMAILNQNQELPRDRVELYREASRVLLHEWDASRSLPVDIFGRQEKEGLLRELAGTMQEASGGLSGNLIDRECLLTAIRSYLQSLGIEGAYEKAIKLVQQLTERNFILCYAGAGRFSFVHRTFLEYFCAAWFVNKFEREQTLALEQLKAEVYGRHWRDETWHEVLRLIVGMIGETQAEHIIRFLMEMDGRSEKLANLMLAAGCLSEVRNRRLIAITDRTLCQRMLTEAIRYDPPYFYEEYEGDPAIAPTRRKALGLIASVWLSTAERWLRSSAIQDPDWIIRSAAIQEFARGWRNDPATLSMLKDRARLDEDGDVRSAAIQELARGWSDDPDTLPWLKDRARLEADGEVRSAVIQELARGWKDDPDTLPWLNDRARLDEDGGVRSVAIQELARGWNDDPDTLFILKDRACLDEDGDVRSAAMQELVRGWSDDPDTLLIVKDRARLDEDGDVRSAAVRALARGWKDDSRTFSMLKDRARFDEYWDVLSAAVQELARGWKDDPGTLHWLKDRACADEGPAVRSAAVRELAQGWKDDPDTLPIVKDRARFDEDWFVRIVAVQQLARAWKDDPDTRPALEDRARSDEQEEMRIAAVQELARGWKDDPTTLLWLKDRARVGDDWAVRSTAVQELARGWKDDPDTLPWLKDCVRFDKHRDVRRAAVQELARSWNGDCAILPMLKEIACCDEHWDVRRAALRALARGWKEDPDTLPMLKDSARSDQHWDVRRAGIEELTRDWKDDPDTLPMLKDRARSDQRGEVRHAALVELARGWKDDPDTLPMLKDRARSDEHWDVRHAAVVELARGWKDDPDTLPILKDRARSDERGEVRHAAVEELVRGWKEDPDTLPMLKDYARSDEHSEVRRAAIEELARGWKAEPDTLPIVKDRARSDEHWEVRHAAVRMLARDWRDDPDTLTVLKDRARFDENADVRLVAVLQMARGWMDDPDTRIVLKDRACSDEDCEVRRAAVHHLASGLEDD